MTDWTDCDNGDRRAAPLPDGTPCPPMDCTWDRFRAMRILVYDKWGPISVAMKDISYPPMIDLPPGIYQQIYDTLLIMNEAEMSGIWQSPTEAIAWVKAVELWFTEKVNRDDPIFVGAEPIKCPSCGQFVDEDAYMDQLEATNPVCANCKGA